MTVTPARDVEPAGTRRSGPERLARVVLVLAGVAAGGYGVLLLRPQVGTTLWWLLAGPVLHDAVLAPLVGLVGLLLGRLATRPVVRWWLRAGLVLTGTLLLIAVPLLWRPHPAPPNPGLQDRDYPAGLASWLAGIWAGVALAVVLSRSRRTRRSSVDHQVGGEETPREDPST